MSLMNCTFTVRWSDEKNEPHAKTIAVKINNKPAGRLQDSEKQAEAAAEQKGFWWQE